MISMKILLIIYVILFSISWNVLKCIINNDFFWENVGKDFNAKLNIIF